MRAASFRLMPGMAAACCLATASVARDAAPPPPAMPPAGAPTDGGFTVAAQWEVHYSHQEQGGDRYELAGGYWIKGGMCGRSELQADAPACDVCGSITVRSGTCYKCLNCGNSMGCS